MFFRDKSNKVKDISEVAENEVNQDVTINFDDSSQDTSNKIDGEAEQTEDFSKKRKVIEEEDNEVRRKRFESGDSAFGENPF